VAGGQACERASALIRRADCSTMSAVLSSSLRTKGLFPMKIPVRLLSALLLLPGLITARTPDVRHFSIR
jgi:hypothetical protein